MAWVDAGTADEIENEDAKRFNYGGRTFAIFRNDLGDFFCTDGHCTHEDVHLADGLVMENTVECPKHASIFDFTTGEVETPPACDNLETYSVRVEDGQVQVDI